MYQGSEKHVKNYQKACVLGHEANKKKKEARIKAYNDNPTLCLHCKEKLPYEKITACSSTKFCSRSCAGRYNNKHKTYRPSEATKKKISKSLKERAFQNSDLQIVSGKLMREKRCLYSRCGATFFTARKKTICCSKECAVYYRSENITDEKRKEMSDRGKEAIKKQAAEGKWKGWNGRGEPSFPEKYITSLLKKDGYVKNTDYKFNLPCCGYFIDFAFEDIKIALEVDGKQHDYPENKERDEKKEKALEDDGWTVVRLRWYNVKTTSGKTKVHNRYKEILSLVESKT